MTPAEYRRAAQIVRAERTKAKVLLDEELADLGRVALEKAHLLQDAFVALFKQTPGFDPVKFRKDCEVES